LTQSQTPTQTRTQSQEIEEEVAETADDDTDDDVVEVVPKAKKPPAPISRNRASSEDEASDDGSQDFDESDWSAPENKTGAYEEFQKRKTVKRKRQAAETNRIRAAKKSRTNAATSIIGRKPQKKKPNARVDAEDEQDSGKEA
jgi:hypothetical protein